MNTDPNILTVTNQFRWVQYNYIHNNKRKTPAFEGEILDHAYGDTGYILEQKWISGTGEEVWHNIEIEYNL